MSAKPSSTGIASARPSRNSTWSKPRCVAVRRDFDSSSAVMSTPTSPQDLNIRERLIARRVRVGVAVVDCDRVPLDRIRSVIPTIDGIADDGMSTRTDD